MARMLATIPRLATLLGLVVLFCGFVVIVAGLAKLQKATNHVVPTLTADGTTISNGFPTANPAKLPDQTFYSIFMTEALITPYPTDPHYQFAYIWFIIFYHLFCLLFAAAVVAVPALGHAARPAALALFAIGTVLVITVVNNLSFVHKNASTLESIGLYKKKDINVTYAGAFLVVLGDFLTLIPLGMWVPEIATAGYGTTKRAPAETATATTTV